MNGRTMGSQVKMNVIISGVSLFLREDVPTIVMAMSIALTNQYKEKGYYFTSIDFGKCEDDEDGYYLPFKAEIKVSPKKTPDGNKLISYQRTEGKVHLNLMLQNPADGCVSFLEVK